MESLIYISAAGNMGLYLLLFMQLVLKVESESESAGKKQSLT